MATVYDTDEGMALAEGLQGSSVCDQARRVAREYAADRGEAVVLDDDDGTWVVHPDGTIEPTETV